MTDMEDKMDDKFAEQIEKLLDTARNRKVSSKVSPTACLGGRTLRALCPCCGGCDGIRAARRHLRKHKWGKP